jgi:hypothetical protein
MGQLPYLVPVPRGATTLNCRPGSAPITHNDACRKLWIASSLLRETIMSDTVDALVLDLRRSTRGYSVSAS